MVTWVPNIIRYQILFGTRASHRARHPLPHPGRVAPSHTLYSPVFFYRPVYPPPVQIVGSSIRSVADFILPSWSHHLPPPRIFATQRSCRRKVATPPRANALVRRRCGPVRCIGGSRWRGGRNCSSKCHREGDRWRIYLMTG